MRGKVNEETNMNSVMNSLFLFLESESLLGWKGPATPSSMGDGPYLNCYGWEQHPNASWTLPVLGCDCCLRDTCSDIPPPSFWEVLLHLQSSTLSDLTSSHSHASYWGKEADPYIATASFELILERKFEPFFGYSLRALFLYFILQGPELHMIFSLYLPGAEWNDPILCSAAHAGPGCGQPSRWLCALLTWIQLAANCGTWIPFPGVALWLHFPISMSSLGGPVSGQNQVLAAAKLQLPTMCVDC